LTKKGILKDTYLNMDIENIGHYEKCSYYDGMNILKNDKIEFKNLVLSEYVKK